MGGRDGGFSETFKPKTACPYDPVIFIPNSEFRIQGFLTVEKKSKPATGYFLTRNNNAASVTRGPASAKAESEKVQNVPATPIVFRHCHC
jgi:hypothetical protein